MGGHLEIVKLLCRHNAELENINKEGKTPLMVALSYGHGAIATYLTAASASVIYERQ
jgi:ankyrin repeat protein